MNDLEEKLARSTANVRIIVTDGVFSQHGDIVLARHVAARERYDAMICIDDAHGIACSARQVGTTERYGINSPRIISMGTLSKGGHGCISMTCRYRLT